MIGKCDLCPNEAIYHVLLESNDREPGMNAGKVCESCLLKLKVTLIEQWTEKEWKECGGE